MDYDIYLLFEDGVTRNEQIVILLNLIHNEKIGINKAMELAEECGLIDDWVDAKWSTKEFAMEHPKHEISDDMIENVKKTLGEKCPVNDDTIKVLLENKYGNINLVVEDINSFYNKKTDDK